MKEGSRLEKLSRLKLVAERLRRVSPPNFRMSWWYKVAEPSDSIVPHPDLEFIDSGTGKHICGTSACALGWATTIPELRRLGLRLRFVNEGYGAIVVYGLQHDFAAARAIFGLTSEEVLFLFSDSTLPAERGYLSKYQANYSRTEPEQAIDRIEYVFDHYFPKKQEGE